MNALLRAVSDLRSKKGISFGNGAKLCLVVLFYEHSLKFMECIIKDLCDRAIYYQKL